ncbi:MAG TPA: hypothetical protein VET65_06770 [Candidatus Limnocylindrales bacterium]|nr:hypothetical protein [Candidatus Limnocylindrales bacterium]
MTHLDDGTLRRLADEPLAISAAGQTHLDACEICRARGARIASEGRAMERLLALPSLQPPTVSAFGRLQARIDSEEAARPVRWYERWFGGPLPVTRRLGAPVVVAVVSALLVASTGYAVMPRLITIFHPTRVVTMQVSPNDVRLNGKTLDYGTLSWNPAPPALEQVASLSAAATAAGMPALTPQSLPAAVGTTVSYGTIGQATASFRFDAAALHASAARQGVSVPAMPQAIDGSTLLVTTGPSILQVYGPLPATQAGQTASANPGAGISGGLPVLVIVQTRVPTVTSTGATAAQLEDYLLREPGVPPDLAAQLRAIKDPASALPIPIPSGLATSRAVQVQGVQAVLIDAGIVSGVVWQKGGIIYAVGGQLTPDQILQVASSLH